MPVQRPALVEVQDGTSQILYVRNIAPTATSGGLSAIGAGPRSATAVLPEQVQYHAGGTPKAAAQSVRIAPHPRHEPRHEPLRSSGRR
jgi:hypothetical protein